MRCPKCKANIGHVVVSSICTQTATLEGNKIVYWDGIDNIGRTVEIDCSQCGEDITKFVKNGD